jgi:hypothetical protein
MDKISPSEIQYLRNNHNTGIEFEYALFYLLNSQSNRTVFNREVIQYHSAKNRILGIIAKSEISELLFKLKALNKNSFVVFLATQVDEVGPADILLRFSDMEFLGLSVKYQNNCTLNVSSKHFLTSRSVILLRSELRNSCQSYIAEMSLEYGQVNNWFRQRKTSKETDLFIDQVRDCVISDWNGKTLEEKKDLLNMLVHGDSPINFWVVKYMNKGDKFKLDLNTNPIKKVEASLVRLTKESSSYVGFRFNGELFGKMQVKFNNGILENAKGVTYDYALEGVNMKAGDPFGSWNFSVL